MPNQSFPSPSKSPILMSRRRSTIHDAAALRLHPNGVRVPLVSDSMPNPRRSVVTVKNHTSNHAHKDARGNWIATDAGGDRRVTKRRKVNVGQSKDVAFEDSSTAEGPGEIDADDIPSQAEIAPVKVYKDARANRRAAFENDLTFLAAPTPVPAENVASHLQPSSDFLKCIHYFASHYYGSKGQLFDSSGQYRKEKKEKRQRRMLHAEVTASQEPENGQEENGSSDEEEHEESLNLAEGVPSATKFKGKQKDNEKVQLRTPRSKETRRDMYKALDGSALLCIGMLLQSHISLSLTDNMPEMWEGDVSTYDTEESGDTDSAPPRPGRENEATKGDTGEHRTNVKEKGKPMEDPEWSPVNTSKEVGKDADESEVDHTDN